MDKRQQLYDTLRKYWGYDSFRPSQLDVMEAVCEGADVLALMPTGAGKSLLYQLPAMTMEGVCVVVTPLVALMKDQVDRLRSLGVPASAIHSGLTSRQIDITLDNAAWGDLKFLYVSPERITGTLFRERIRKTRVCLLAVDEAHCISQWGYDFRPSYLRIADLREIAAGAPVLALTASATPLVCEDIVRHMLMTGCRTIRADFARPNITFSVRHTDDKEEQLMRIVRNVPGTGIVYARTREGCEKLASLLRERGVDAEAYHAGMPHAERSAKQERWAGGGCRIMVATNAFGMGIDKAEVRFVVHYDICDSLEGYYQEAGRGGRDGRRAYAVLLTASDDRSRAVKRFETEFPPLNKIIGCYEQLFNYLQVGIGDGKYASFAFNMHEFAGRARMYTATAYNAIKILQQNGYMTLTDEADNPPRIMFTVGRDDLYKIRIDREELDHVLRTILRLYEGLFGGRLVPIDEREIAQASGYTPEKVRELLKTLWQLRVIKYVPGGRSPILLLNEERLPSKDVYISPESYRIRKEMAMRRIEAMYDYAANTERCRSAVIREYFGEKEVSDCGTCDICIERRRGAAAAEASRRQTGDRIVELLGGGPLEVKEIVARFRTEPDMVIKAIDELKEKGIVSCRAEGKIGIKG